MPTEGSIAFTIGDTVVNVPTVLADAASPNGDQVFSGNVSLPGGFTVPAGETWHFDPNVSTTVRVRSNVIVEGRLVMRPANRDIKHELIFEGVNEAAFLGGGMVPVPTDVGLWVIEHGQLDAHGFSKSAWTKASGPLAAGATTVQVAGSGGWQPGDTLVFTPTAPISTSTWWDRYSTRKIVSIDPQTKVITLDGGLQNAHPATFAPCEVLNLTRNVKISGTVSGKAHVAFMHAHRPVNISNVEFSYLGVRGKLGRYPLHFHMMGDDARGSTIEGCVVHDSGNHAFVPHTSNGITFTTCVAHNIWDSAFWWDQDGSPTSELTLEACVASKVDGGYRVAGFNHSVDDNRGGPTNLARKNRCFNCVSVGVAGNGDQNGFNNGSNSADPGGFEWPERDAEFGGEWTWHDNVSHNHRFNGIFTWQNDDLKHVVQNAHIYNCGAGINHGAYFNRYVYQDILIEGCRFGIWQHSQTTSGDRAKYERLTLKVTGPRAVLINSGTAGPSGTPGLRFINCDFSGYTTSGVQARGDGGTPADDEWPPRAQFIDCTWAPTLPHVQITNGAVVGTTIQEIEGGVVVAEFRR